MKKVLHISKYYSPFAGGVEQIARDCVTAYQGSAEQKVICFDHRPKSSDSIDHIDGVEVIRCGQQLLVASQAISNTYGDRLREVIQDFDPDIIIFHYPNPFVSHYLLKYITPSAKLIVYWHLDIIRQKFIRKFFTMQNLRLLQRADKIVATSPNYIEGSKWLTRFQNKCTVIPNCINENRLATGPDNEAMAREIRDTHQGKIICLTVGRHVTYKGTEFLIRASKLLDDRFEFRIIGQGPLTGKLMGLAQGDHKIKFLGQVNDDVLKANLLACDIFCFPSITKNEAFGVALAEGMYFGKPAVTFTIPGSGVNYVNINNKTGIEVANRDVEGYAAALKRLAQDDDMRRLYGEEAHKRVVENLLYAQFKDSVLELLKD